MSEPTTTPAQTTAQPPAKAPAARAPKKYDALLTALAKAPEDPSEPDGMKLMSPAGAQLLLGWLLAQGAEIPKEAKLLIKSARDLRVQHPRVWKPLQRSAASTACLAPTPRSRPEEGADDVQ